MTETPETGAARVYFVTVASLTKALDEVDFAACWDETPVIEGGVRVATEANLNVRRLAAAILDALDSL